MLTLTKPKSPRIKYRKKAKIAVTKQQDTSHFEQEEVTFRRHLSWGAIGISAALCLLMLYMFDASGWFLGLIEK